MALGYEDKCGLGMDYKGLGMDYKSESYPGAARAEETVEEVERTTLRIEVPGFVFGAAICISVAGLIAIGVGIGLLF